MAEHYPRNTAWVGAHCKSCNKETPHRVDDRRKGPCLNCIAKRQEEHEAARRRPPQSQIDLFPPAA